jgi:hypothetical protein
VKLGFTQEEADREIFLEAARTEPPSKFELEYLAEERAAEEVWRLQSAPAIPKGRPLARPPSPDLPPRR